METIYTSMLNSYEEFLNNYEHYRQSLTQAQRDSLVDKWVIYNYTFHSSSDPYVGLVSALDYASMVVGYCNALMEDYLASRPLK